MRIRATGPPTERRGTQPRGAFAAPAYVLIGFKKIVRGGWKKKKKKKRASASNKIFEKISEIYWSTAFILDMR
jgi:hypothetical protein